MRSTSAWSIPLKIGGTVVKGVLERAPLSLGCPKNARALCSGPQEPWASLNSQLVASPPVPFPGLLTSQRENRTT